MWIQDVFLKIKIANKYSHLRGMMMLLNILLLFRMAMGGKNLNIEKKVFLRS